MDYAPTSTSTPQKQSAEVRQHRLEKRVVRLRVSRPAALTLPHSDHAATTTTMHKKKKRVHNNPNDDDDDDDDNDDDDAAAAHSEPFVPSQAPATESEKVKAAQTRDRVWITEYWIELSLILLGLNVGPLLYYYFVSRAPSSSSGGSGMQTGVSFFDHWTQHLAAPVQYARYWSSRDNLPSAVTEFARTYAALLTLLASLAATVALLWNKTELLQSLANLSKMQAAPATHVAIAWSWLSAMFAFTFGNAVGWMFNFTWTLVGYVAVVLFSHTFAGLAQAALYGYLLYMFSGLGKRVETGSFGVTVPDPDAAAATGHAAVVRGGGMFGASSVLSPLPNDRELAALFAGPGAAAVGVPEDMTMMQTATTTHGGAAGAAGELFSAAALLGKASGTTDAVVPLLSQMTAMPTQEQQQMVMSAAEEAVAAASSSSATSVASSVEAAVAALPAYESMPQIRNDFLSNANRGAYQASKVTNEVTLALFAVVKLVNANMQTPAGNLFAIAANGLLLAGSVGTAAHRLRSSYVASASIPW